MQLQDIGDALWTNCSVNFSMLNFVSKLKKICCVSKLSTLFHTRAFTKRDLDLDHPYNVRYARTTLFTRKKNRSSNHKLLTMPFHFNL